MTGLREQHRSGPSIVLAICAIGLCVVGLLAILATRARFMSLFDEMGIELSLISRLAIGPLLPLLLFVLAVSGIAKELIPVPRTIRNWWNFLLLLAGLIATATYVAGMFSPLMLLLEGLS